MRLLYFLYRSYLFGSIVCKTSVLALEDLEIKSSRKIYDFICSIEANWLQFKSCHSSKRVATTRLDKLKLILLRGKTLWHTLSAPNARRVDMSHTRGDRLSCPGNTQCRRFSPLPRQIFNGFSSLWYSLRLGRD